jgi:acyl-CoA reductase-like NAD-dependent aldehyde dehydrogenase
MPANEFTKIYANFYQQKNEVSNVGRIINKQHWKRVMDLISASRGTIIQGGIGDEKTLFIKPTIITNVLENDAIVETEIFGPVMPLLKFSKIEDAKRLAHSLSPGGLALYVFTEDLTEANDLVASCLAGTAAINDCMAQIAPSSLPFGGVGESGFGAYRGKASIDTFSHKQSVVTVPTAAEFEALLGWRYPPAESMETVNFVKGALESKL